MRGYRTKRIEDTGCRNTPNPSQLGGPSSRGQAVLRGLADLNFVVLVALSPSRSVTLRSVSSYKHLGTQFSVNRRFSAMVHKLYRRISGNSYNPLEGSSMSHPMVLHCFECSMCLKSFTS